MSGAIKPYELNQKNECNNLERNFTINRLKPIQNSFFNLSNHRFFSSFKRAKQFVILSLGLGSIWLATHSFVILIAAFLSLFIFFLIVHKPKAEVKDSFGRTPLFLAAERGDKVAIKALLLAGAHINAKDCLKRTPLMIASEKGREKAVKLLIKARADKEAKDSFDLTALMHASINNRKKVVKILIASGANKNTKNKHGQTPLSLARLHGHLALVEILKA